MKLARLTKCALTALLALSAVAAQVALSRRRPPQAADAISESAFAALGGLRSLAAEFVWFRADRLQAEGKFVELAQLAYALAMSEPHNDEIWSYAAWNLAYNVAAMTPGAEERWRWVHAAVRLLRDDALSYNPRSPAIHRDLAQLFSIKIGGQRVDDAAETYRAKWREIVKDVERRDAWGEIGFEKQRMADVERIFGLSDRGDAQYAAAYWALRGLKAATRENDRRSLAASVRLAVLLYAKSHNLPLPAEAAANG